MTLPEIIDLNYRATCKRKQITEYTRLGDMLDKAQEELNELREALSSGRGLDRKELADLALVCFTIAKHHGFDLIPEMEEKAKFNLIRED